jgi:hypothetical protein
MAETNVVDDGPKETQDKGIALPPFASLRHCVFALNSSSSIPIFRPPCCVPNLEENRSEISSPLRSELICYTGRKIGELIPYDDQSFAGDRIRPEQEAATDNPILFERMAHLGRKNS